jgi:hypothetical protein
MAKLVWRVKVVADLGSGAVSETEVARIERDDFAVPETVGLSLDESKQLTAAIQAEIVRCQAAVVRALRGKALEQRLLPRHIPLALR